MMVEVVRRPSRCAARCTSSHWPVLILSGQMMARTSSSRISAAVPGRVPRPASFSCARNSRTDSPSVAAPCVTSERREGVDVHLGDRRLDRPADRLIGVAGVVGMDAALQADFGRAAIPRLDRAARDFLDGEIVRRAAQILVRAAFREGAELAAEIADVGVVDVAVDDVAHDVAADRAAQRVGGLRDVPVVGVARREQAHDVGVVEPFARCGTLDDACDAGIDAAGEHQRRRRRLGIARRPVIVAREAFGVAHAPHAGGDVGSQPVIGGAHIGGIDRQAVHQHLAGLRALAARARQSRATALRGSRDRASPARCRPSR